MGRSLQRDLEKELENLPESRHLVMLVRKLPSAELLNSEEARANNIREFQVSSLTTPNLSQVTKLMHGTRVIASA